jgi:hypothetical protein
VRDALGCVVHSLLEGWGRRLGCQVEKDGICQCCVWYLLFALDEVVPSSDTLRGLQADHLGLCLLLVLTVFLALVASARAEICVALFHQSFRIGLVQLLAFTHYVGASFPLSQPALLSVVFVNCSRGLGKWSFVELEACPVELLSQ